MEHLKGKRVIVTGGDGFLGSHLMEQITAYECEEVFVPKYPQIDLTREKDIRQIYEQIKPHTVIHLAAVVGGIGANRANPGKFFYDNLMMGVLNKNL